MFTSSGWTLVLISPQVESQLPKVEWEKLSQIMDKMVETKGKDATTNAKDPRNKCTHIYTHQPTLHVAGCLL